MNKVISINIGGSIFQVEEDAFEKLNTYLTELKKHFSSKAEGAEIITDIENRIAELLRSKLNPMKAAININDVNEVTASMGSPKDFESEEEAASAEPKSNTEEKKQSTNNNYEYKRSQVYRDPDARIVGGVCSGLGHYFNIDPLWIRLFFVLVTITAMKAMFFGMSPLVVYVILWIIIPEAKTTAEKLQMRKEQINIDNIQKSVQTEFNKVKDTFESKDFQVKATSFARRLADFIKMIILGALNLVRGFARFIFIALGIVALIIAFSSLSGQMVLKNTPLFHPVNLFQFFDNASDTLLAQATFFFVALAAGLVLFTMAYSLAKNRLTQKTHLVFRTVTILVSIAACVLAVTLAAKVTSYFAAGETIENFMPLDSTQKHFYIRNPEGERYWNGYGEHGWKYTSFDTLRFSDIRIEIEASNDATGSVTETKMSRGQRSDIAKMNASSILALASVKDSVISLPGSFSLVNNQVYRKQEIIYVVKLPLGSKFTIDERMYSQIDINSPNNDVYVHTLSTFCFTKNGIECLDCTTTYGSTNVNTSGYPLNIPLDHHEFKNVEISSSLNVKIIRGNEYLIKLRGTENMSDLEVNFHDNEVHLSDGRKWSLGLLNIKDLEVIIVMPEIESLHLSGSAEALLDGFQEDELKIELSGASTCKTNIEARHLDADLSGASTLFLDGKISTCNAEVTGASKLMAASTPIREITIEASGASFAEVNCTEHLEADASGASNIKYKGDAKNVNAKNSGASSVERE